MSEFIDWETLEFKKRSGTEKIICPACHSRRKNKRDRSLSVNHGKGVGKCHYCDALTFKENNEQPQQQEKEYIAPKQDWKNYTTLSDRMVKYLEGRKIPQHIAIELGFTEEKHYQPAKGKEVTNLVFNTLEGEKLVNKKYRSADKKFTQSAGGKPILYNINAAVNQKELWIVEGELDVAALYAVGIKNVVSVPNGANDNDEYWANSKKYIEDVEHFVLGFDNDEKGKAILNAVAQRLGRYRCSYIEWERKDANGDLMALKLDVTVKQRKRFPVAGTNDIDDYIDEILEYYDTGLPATVKPKARSFGNLGNFFSVMRGQLTTITGIPSHGKSNFTDWYVLNLVNDYKMKGSWFSPEHTPTSLYNINFIEKVTGDNFWGKAAGAKVDRISKKTIERYRAWAKEKIYFTNPDKGQMPNWDWLLETFKEQMFAYGIDIFVIDAFNKVILPKGSGVDEIRSVLTKLTAFAQVNNVMIFLVAHPTKMRKKDDDTYGIPTLYDIAGSADFRNMTHNGLTVYRNYETDISDESTQIINTKTKFNFQGVMNESAFLKYNPLNGRYHTGQSDNRSFLDVHLPIDDEPEYDETDEVPF